jgi:hypothetical protein
MLDKSRIADSGVKLEVNSKILDSCTELMLAIRNLVKKSRLLQIEIVAQGKGSASATEFYKRNHEWSEGLISAAKAIAMAANFLLYVFFFKNIFILSRLFINFINCIFMKPYNILHFLTIIYIKLICV